MKDSIKAKYLLENSEIEDIISEYKYSNKLNLKYLDKNMNKYKDILSIYAYSNFTNFDQWFNKTNRIDLKMLFIKFESKVFLNHHY